MHRLQGAGLPNVYLIDGVVECAGGSIAYNDVDGLFAAIATAIALRALPMTPAELRFMRKRLGMTQAQLGAIGDKSSQIAAMWEKGTRPVPKAEANQVRLIWLERHAKRLLAAAIRTQQNDGELPCDHVLRFDEVGGWREDRDEATALANKRAEEATAQAIAAAMSGATMLQESTAAVAPNHQFQIVDGSTIAEGQQIV